MDEQRDLVQRGDAAPRLDRRAHALPTRLERRPTIQAIRRGDQWSSDAAAVSAPAARPGPVQTADRGDQEQPLDPGLDATAATRVTRPAAGDAPAAPLATGERLSQERLALPPPLTAAASPSRASQPTDAVSPPPLPPWRSGSPVWRR